MSPEVIWKINTTARTGLTIFIKKFVFMISPFAIAALAGLFVRQSKNANLLLLWDFYWGKEVAFSTKTITKAVQSVKLFN